MFFRQGEVKWTRGHIWIQPLALLSYRQTHYFYYGIYLTAGVTTIKSSAGDFQPWAAALIWIFLRLKGESGNRSRWSMHARIRQFSHLVCTRQFSHLVSRQTVPPFSQGVYSSFFLISTHLPCLPKFVFLWGHQQNSCCVVLLLARGRVTALRPHRPHRPHRLGYFQLFHRVKMIAAGFPTVESKGLRPLIKILLLCSSNVLTDSVFAKSSKRRLLLFPNVQ